MGKVKMITPKQVQRLHIMKDIIECDDERWYAALWELCKVLSTKDLTYDQAEHLIGVVRRCGTRQGFMIDPASGKNRNLDERPGFATAKQLDFIENLWAEITKAKTEEESVKGLREFLQKQAGVSDIRFLKVDAASKVIFVLKKLKESKPKKGGKAQRSKVSGGKNEENPPVSGFRVQGIAGAGRNHSNANQMNSKGFPQGS